MHVVSSRNFFIDTASDLQGGKGDNITLNLNQDTITAGSGQQLRLTLREFSMYKNFYNININNSKFKFTSNVDESEADIPFGNYNTCGSIASAFGIKLAEVILAHAQAGGSLATSCTPVDILPDVNETLATGQRIMSFTLRFDSAHGLSNLLLQCLAEVSELWALLGGDRVNDTSSSTPSFVVTIQGTIDIKVSGFYPMQRSTESHVFLRCGLPNSNIQTASLSGATGPYHTHTLASNILGVIPIDTEFCHFSSNTDNEFFINVSGPSISALRLYLTDSKNRPLGREAGSNKLTAGSVSVASVGGNQSTLGNLNFKAIIRLDVIQAMIPRNLNTKMPQHLIPARLDNGIISNLPTD